VYFYLNSPGILLISTNGKCVRMRTIILIRHHRVNWNPSKRPISVHRHLIITAHRRRRHWHSILIIKLWNLVRRIAERIQLMDLVYYNCLLVIQNLSDFVGVVAGSECSWDHETPSVAIDYIESLNVVEPDVKCFSCWEVA
jgi:hypothetical protein